MGPQTVRGLHTRSVVAVTTLEAYSVATLHTVRSTHWRLPAGVQGESVARNYAEALLVLARKADDAAGWGTMLRQVATAIRTDTTLARFLESPRISGDAKSAVLTKALELTGADAVGGRDAVHAATALLWGFDVIVSPDRDFEGIPGLRRLEPADALG